MSQKEIYIHPIFEEVFENFKLAIASSLMICHPTSQLTVLSIFGKSKNAVFKIENYEKTFNMGDFFQNINKKIERTLLDGGKKYTGNLNSIYNAQARLIVIFLFDVLQNCRYHKRLNREEIYKFTRHIRNGVAHNNKFVFDKPLKKEILWRDKIIKQEFHLGKEVFNSFINIFDIPLLINDLSILIKNYEDKHK